MWHLYDLNAFEVLDVKARSPLIETKNGTYVTFFSTIKHIGQWPIWVVSEESDIFS
jgi:hypothetical protein